MRLDRTAHAHCLLYKFLHSLTDQSDQSFVQTQHAHPEPARPFSQGWTRLVSPRPYPHWGWVLDSTSRLISPIHPQRVWWIWTQSSSSFSAVIWLTNRRNAKHHCHGLFFAKPLTKDLEGLLIVGGESGNSFKGCTIKERSELRWMADRYMYSRKRFTWWGFSALGNVCLGPTSSSGSWRVRMGGRSVASKSGL